MTPPHVVPVTLSLGDHFHFHFHFPFLHLRREAAVRFESHAAGHTPSVLSSVVSPRSAFPVQGKLKQKKTNSQIV
jgi:hypothetical protein